MFYLDLTQIHHRRSMRLKNHDYSQGLYFVTLCTRKRECLFGEIVQGEMKLNDYGKIAKEEWMNTPEIRKGVSIDAFVIMPNHVHGILNLEYKNDSLPVGAYCNTPLQRRSLQSPSKTLGAIIRGFKGSVTKRIRILDGYEGKLWQRNYHEHCIDGSEEDRKSALHRIRQYIIDNPRNWETDENNIR